nr:uncharacterized protein LOC129166739 [Nothobranchius furzeri]
MADQQELLWQRGRPLTSRQSRRRSRYKSIPRSGHSPCLFSRNQARDGTRTIRQTGRSLPLYLTGFHAPHWDSEMTSRIFYWSSCNRNDVLTWAAAVKSEARTRKASADHNSTTDYERTDNARNTQILPDVRVSAEVSPPLPDTVQDDAVAWSLLPPVTPRLCNSEALSNLSSSLGHLTSSQQEELSHLIHSFPELFSDVSSQTHLITHDISLTDSVPVRMHPDRASPMKRELMRKEVTYLLEHGLAKPSTSSLSSPCLLENKPDGSYRFVTDYRKLNAKTVPDSFPLPRVEDCVDSVGSATFVTKLDLLKAYWQVPLTPFASKVSAFVTPDNLLQYTVLPFGLRNAPATFQRFQQELLLLPPTMQEESRPSQRHPLSWLDDDAEMVAACKSVEDSLISKQPTIGAAATRTSPKAPALQRLLVFLLLLIPLLLNPLLVR